MTNHQSPNGPQNWQGNPNQSPNGPQNWQGNPNQPQPWQGQPYMQQQSPDKKRGGCLKWFAIIAVAFIALIIVVAAVSGGSNDSSIESQDGQAGVSEAREAGQPDSKATTVRYEVETSDGSNVSVTYANAGDGVATAQDNATTSPWSHEITVGEHEMLNVNVLAQQDGSSDVTCRIFVNGEEVTTNTSSGPYSIATCNFSDFLR